jgi:hypothetical protein
MPSKLYVVPFIEDLNPLERNDLQVFMSASGNALSPTIFPEKEERAWEK